VKGIAREIARYLVEHPDAADTLDGIRRWWLTRQRYEDATVLVQRAVELLVREGAAVGRKMPDGNIVYGSTRSGGSSTE
jgi:hypothetical protein